MLSGRLAFMAAPSLSVELASTVLVIHMVFNANLNPLRC